MPLAPHAAQAADTAASCCADLEQRIAALEAISARAGRQGFEVKVSGSVNRAVLFWDDGHRRDAAVVTNDADNSSLTIESETGDLVGGWSIGMVADFDVLSNGSSEISQHQDQSAAALEPGEISVWLKNESLGQITLGLTSAKGSSGGSNEADLSATELAGYVGVSDIGGGFALSRKGGPYESRLTHVTWDMLIDSLDEPDGSVIAYNSPEVAGFAFSALWGEDDVWNVGVGYTNDHLGPISVVVRAAINEDLNNSSSDGPDDRTVSGSIALLHLQTGLNIAIAGGTRTYIGPIAFNTGRLGTPDSSSFAYVKAGWRASLFETGETAFYAEYGRFTDFLGRGADAETVASLSAQGPQLIPALVCTGASLACLSNGSDASIWGAGVVQSFGEADVKVYAGARHSEASVDLITSSGARTHAAPLSALDTVIAGVQLEF